MAPSVSPSPTPNPALNPPEGGDPATRPFALKPSGPKSTAAPTKDADPLNLLSELTSKFFDEIATELLPLSPEEIKAFRAKIDTRAKALSDSPPGSLASRAVAFRVAPGLDPPKVTLTPGLVTALVFTTPSGQPWPVTSNALGSGSLFNAEILTGAEHQILVSPLAHHGHSNLVVGLKGLDQPLMIRLEIASGVDPNRQVDGLVNFQIRNANRPTSNEAGVSLTPGLSTAYDLLEGRDPGDGRFCRPSRP
jgi:hypothetical protein